MSTDPVSPTVPPAAMPQIHLPHSPAPPRRVTEILSKKHVLESPTTEMYCVTRRTKLKCRSAKDLKLPSKPNHLVSICIWDFLKVKGSWFIAHYVWCTVKGCEAPMAIHWFQTWSSESNPLHHLKQVCMSKGLHPTQVKLVQGKIGCPAGRFKGDLLHCRWLIYAA